MKNYLSLFLLCMVTLVQAQTKGELSSRFDSKRAADHFVFQWNEHQTTELEIDEAATFAEEIYGKLTAVFGSERMPEKKLIITLRGEGLDRSTGRKRTPHVDGQGRIHLYRFAMGGYLSPLPHEMVHAIRVGTVPFWQGFFEEGIASGIAQHLYPGQKGFPRFGYDLDLVAGYWLSSGRSIPMNTLLKEHNRLNLKCQLQSYVMREDFFNYLIDHHGLAGLVELFYAQHVGTDEGYLRYTGESFDVLVAAWEQDLIARYAKIDQAESLINNYFENTSARYIPVCEAGTDY